MLRCRVWMIWRIQNKKHYHHKANVLLKLLDQEIFKPPRAGMPWGDRHRQDLGGGLAASPPPDPRQRGSDLTSLKTKAPGIGLARLWRDVCLCGRDPAGHTLRRPFLNQGRQDLFVTQTCFRTRASLDSYFLIVKIKDLGRTQSKAAEEKKTPT